MQYGLFQVHDRIFQVRGYDLSNISFIQGETGWIVFDPLISAETAKATYDLIT
jgi:linear primary-alkylsulfatase